MLPIGLDLRRAEAGSVSWYRHRFSVLVQAQAQALSPLPTRPTCALITRSTASTLPAGVTPGTSTATMPGRSIRSRTGTSGLGLGLGSVGQG